MKKIYQYHNKKKQVLLKMLKSNNESIKKNTGDLKIKSTVKKM